MSRQTKIAFRPMLDTLMTRELPTASPAALVIPHAAHFIGPVSYDEQIQSNAQTSTKSTIKPSAVSLDGFYTVSVVTIQNRTTSALNFQLQWPNSSLKSYTLKAGETRLYYITATNAKATIDYDYSFAPGIQHQKYSLASKNFNAGGFAGFSPSRPTDGQQYYFTTNSRRTGLNFYHV
jgi:hypothetical protein